MEGMRTAFISMGCTALICGLVEILAPKDRFKGILETVIGIFALIMTVSVFKSCELNAKGITDTVASSVVSADKAFDEVLEEETSAAIGACFAEKLKEAEIHFYDIRVKAEADEGKVSIKTVTVISDGDEEKIKKIGDEMGITTEIERNVPAND